MSQNLAKQKKLIEKIAFNIIEQEMRTVVQGQRTYPEIYMDVRKTVDYAARIHKKQTRKNGEPYIFHPLHVALIAAENGMVDKISIDSCMLHDVIEDGGVSRKEISELFGEEVAEIVEGLTKIRMHKAESYDKFFSHTVHNPRIAYIKIFDRLHNLRTLWPHSPSKQMIIAEESMEIYHKLCIRLCLTDIANEIESLCAPVLYPDKFDQFSARLQQIQKWSGDIINSFKMNVLEKCHENDVKIRKIRVQWKPFLDIPDYELMQVPGVLLFKLVVDSVENAYKMLWVLNTSYKVAGDIEDSISVPRFNNFRGIQYTVIVEGVKIPVLITTDTFNEFNRKGILVYGSFSNDTEINMKFMKHLQEYLTDESNFLDIKTLTSFIEKDEIQVFAKDGKTMIDLKKGSTVLDFAFKIHSDLGLRADYGVVDGVRVGLRHQLQNGNIVHVYTKNEVTATEEYLRKCVTPKAHRVLKKYFETARIEAVFNVAKEYLEKNLSLFHVDSKVFWEKLHEACPTEREILDRVLETLHDIHNIENMLIEFNLIDGVTLSAYRKKGESLFRILNIFSVGQKGLPVEVDFMDIHYLPCPYCIPTFHNGPHRGVLEDTKFIVHSGNCQKIKDFPEERIFPVKLRKTKQIESEIYMVIETDDVSGITHAISSVFKNTNLEMFNVENDHVKALYRLAFYQKSPQTVSSYLDQLRKIHEVRGITISTKNIFSMYPLH